MAITIDDFSKIWASTSPLTPYSFSDDNYKSGWNFIGSTPPSRQMWDFLQKNNDEKMQYLADNYLPLSGGTMTGTIKRGGWATFVETVGASSVLEFDAYPKSTSKTADGASIILFGKDHAGAGRFNIDASNGSTAKSLRGETNGNLSWSGNTFLLSASDSINSIKNSSASSSLHIFGSNDDATGANLWLFGNNSAGAGRFDLYVTDGSTARSLRGWPNGTLQWNGQPIQTTSDKRLKQDFSDVPADVLDAWSKVEWKQFKYNADKERKGDSCRWHTGLVAQDVQEVCGEKILKYGILCHDVQEATEEQEAVDMWTVRYTEALCMEVIYLRNEIKKLHEEINKLK